MYFTTSLICVCLLRLGLAGYTLEDDYSTDNFFSMFNFETGNDLNGGYVNYVDQATAQSSGLINTNNNQIYIGVDYTNQATGRGRSSVRIESKKQYNHGLVVLDLQHMPGGICGTWPAFWMYGPNWPSSGEIDIIEGVNNQASNSMTLHTSTGCAISNMNNPQVFTAQIMNSDCDSTSGSSTGCQFTATNTQTYGTGFNSNGGGVYAMEWTSVAIKVWFWPRGTAPPDIQGPSPNPSNWNTPQSYFAGGCDIDQHFMNNWLVFDNTFCGAWAGNAWGGSSCNTTYGNSCQDFVQNTPGAFQDAYWLINSLNLYQESGTSDTATPVAEVAAAPKAVAEPVSSTNPASSSQAVVPTSSSSSASVISVPASTTSTSVPSISSLHTSPLATSTLTPSTLASSTLAISTMTPITSLSTLDAVLSTASSSPPESTTVAGSSTQQSIPEATPADLLLSVEFGKGSKGIPESNIPQRRRHARHLQDHVRRDKTHI